jgi:hypothetical protein
MLKGPFAKDRNQLNGIGSHEMPVNWSWGDSRLEDPGVLPSLSPAARSLSVNGGIPDLRDAEFSFVLRADKLEQRGSALTFWILSPGQDELGIYASQWALTGDPFPDAALVSDGQWHEVTLKLPNDPKYWTYTGNNPKEQGARSNRYRRLPLPRTLSRCGDAFVLIFVYGDERDVPVGNFSMLEVRAKYRDLSLLSPAAGAVLTSWPLSSPSDPLVLTNGSRCYDDELWVSGTAPTFPLAFTWALPRPVTLSSFQINQHLFYPTKDVEVLGRRASDGDWESVWRGEMPDSYNDIIAPPYVHVKTKPETAYTELRLQIHSGHQPERCGLDSFEVLGEGAAFTGDGLPCTLSEEVHGLPPGATTYYRIVVDEGGDGEIVRSDISQISIPATQAPLIFSAIPRKRVENPRCFFVRGNAMGLEAELSGELRLATGEVFEGPTFYFGRQPTGRHIHYNIPDGWPERDGVVRLTLSNALTDTVMEIPWPPAWTI